MINKILNCADCLKVEAFNDDNTDTIKQSDGEWHFVMTKPDDSGWQIEIHCMLFDVYEARS